MKILITKIILGIIAFLVIAGACYLSFSLIIWYPKITGAIVLFGVVWALGNTIYEWLKPTNTH